MWVLDEGVIQTIIKQKGWLTLAWGTLSGRLSACALYAAGKIYLYGGYNGSYTGELWSYDVASKVWAKLASGTARANPVGGLIDGKLYFFGGGTGSSTTTGAFAYYDIAANAWTTITGDTGRPTAREHHRAVVVDKKIYVFGGSGSIAALYVYNPTTNTWTTLTSAPQGRTGAFMEAINNKLYVFGGSTGSTYQNTTLVYDIAAGTWSTLTTTNAPPGRGYGASAVVKGDLVILGGTTSGTTVAAGPGEAWRLNVTTGAWTQMPNVPFTARTQPSGCTTPDGLVFAGGRVGASGQLADIYSYAE